MGQNTDKFLRIGKATVDVPCESGRRRLEVTSAALKLLPRGRVRLSFEGSKGSVSIALSRVAFWRLSSVFHEASIADESRDNTSQDNPPR